MRLFLNQKQIPSAAQVYFNGRPVKRTFFNGVRVWLRAVLLHNPVAESAELAHVWNDAGDVKETAALFQGVLEEGHQYYVRTNYSCWGYRFSEGAFAVGLKLTLGDTVLAEKNGDGSYAPEFAAVHTLVAGSGTQIALNAAVQRNNSSQGGMRTKETMVVDVTRLYEEGYHTPEAVWNRIGFFRGSRQIEF